MRHVIIASHHLFADGLRDTLEFVAGTKDIRTVCAYMDAEQVEEQAQRALEAVRGGDEALILTDVFQGSVNQAFLPYVREGVHLVSGVSVPCALELVMLPEPLEAQAIREAVERAREQIVYAADYVANESDDDE